MPTCDPTTALTVEEARERIWKTCFTPTRGEAPIGHVGLEPELFPIRVGDQAQPEERLLLHGKGGVLEAIDALAAVQSDWIGPRCSNGGSPCYRLANGGKLTFEPGGQVEHSTAPHRCAASAAEDVEETSTRLRMAFGDVGAVLAAGGVDRWHDASEIPQQLDAPRYRAMAAYFDKIDPSGRVMMRNSTSTQVNLDFGSGQVLQERWCLANLISPVVTGTFASSPSEEGSVSARALAWQRLDPSRTGFPERLCRNQGPLDSYVDAALNASVMMFWRIDGDAQPGDPGFGFGHWIANGREGFGWPTEEDLDYHLSTLFFEVRPRGFLELRAIEALPERWRFVPMVLLTGLFYDEVSRSQGLAALESVARELPMMWSNAAHQGLADPRLAELACTIWPTALEGARRLPEGFIREKDLKQAEAFLEQFTLRGRMPADELRMALESGSAAALRWMVEGTVAA
jgi:glutamate--cysteine ligase